LLPWLDSLVDLPRVVAGFAVYMIPETLIREENR
jgi:hypothetical protein